MYPERYRIFLIPAADLKLKMNRKFIFGLGVLIQNFLYYLHNQNITIKWKIYTENGTIN